MVTHGRNVRKHLGKDYATVYFALVSLIIESVLPYTLSGIAFLVSFGIGSDISIAFACVYIPLMVSTGSVCGSVTSAYGLQCISPQMLILRVASGRAWNEETGKALPSMLKFAPGDGSVWTESQGFEDSDGTRHKLETISSRKETV